MIDPGTEEKLEKLLKMLSSDRDGEVLAAARAIQRTLSGAGADIHELAARIKGGKLSEAEMQKIYNAAYREGKESAAVDKGFGDIEGPSYYQMAQYCAEHSDRLNEKEQGFVNDMVRWCARREPSEKQGKWLHVLYVRVGRRR
jgi:hypothetical protein